MTITEQMIAEGWVDLADPKTWAIRTLALWEDQAEAGETVELSPDDLAMIRHELQIPR